MKFDAVDRLRVNIAIASVITLFAIFYLFSLDDEPTYSLNGDSLGQETTDESFGQYIQRAQESLHTAQSEWPEEKSFGLVSFSQELTPAEAHAITENLFRANAMLVGITVPRALPEPVAGENRQAVYERQLELISKQMDGMEMPQGITAIIAWDTPSAFAAVEGHDQVAAVEVLPPDAAWGQFGISPVFVPGVV